MGIKINIHGLICVVLIGLMILAAALTSGSRLIYNLVAIVLYVGVVVYITREREQQAEDHRYIVPASRRLLQIRLLIGAHLAFVLLLIGAVLTLGDLIPQVVFFAAAVAIGLLVPFVVITKDVTTAPKNG